jgi:hypothetical protein
MRAITVLAIASLCAATFTSRALEPADSGAALGAQVEAVALLYGIDVGAASERLSKEKEAADVYRRVLAAGLPGYSGAWRR